MTSAPSHAGGVVYRHHRGRLEFLLVRSKDRTCRVLPKGHVEPGEDAPAAAVREVREEAGYALAPARALGVFAYIARGRRVATAYYLMPADGADPGDLDEPFRDPRWFALEDLERADLPVPQGVAELLERARAAIESAT